MWACRMRSSGTAEGEPGLMAHADRIATLLQGLPKGKLAAERLRPPLTNCPTHVLAAAFTALDIRGAAQRALDVFRVLRALPPSDPLSALCDTYTYASLIALVRHPPTWPGVSGRVQACVRTLAMTCCHLWCGGNVDTPAAWGSQDALAVRGPRLAAVVRGCKEQPLRDFLMRHEA